MTEENWAKIAALFAGLVFGIYWIPLRALDAAGLSGLWAAFIFNAVPFCLVLPLLLSRWRVFARARVRFHVCGLILGTGFTLYTSAFLFTDVIKAILLFYMMPIWGFLLARFVLKDALTPVRWLAIALGVFGMAIIFGVDTGIPIPENIGDWMALAAGMIWSVGSLMLLTDRVNRASDYTIALFFWGMVTASSAAVLTASTGLLAWPDWSGFPHALVWLIPVAILVLLPGGFATVYGPSKLNPGVAGLLFMSEISIGTITAALFSGEPFGLREILGVVAITLAGLIEPLSALWKRGGNHVAPRQ